MSASRHYSGKLVACRIIVGVMIFMKDVDMRFLQKNTVSWLIGCSLVLSGCSSHTDLPEKQMADAARQEPHSSADTTQAGKPALPADTSRLALDWAGTYSGTVPCASCPGIETVVTLHDDGTYRRSLHYIDDSPSPVTETGTFTWNEAGSIVTLGSDESGPRHYQVGEHHLRQLDMQGQRIKGDLADRYILHQHVQELNGKPIGS